MIEHEVSRQWFASYAFEDPDTATSEDLSAETPEDAPEIEQRYQRVSVIGEGGMGRVWLGWDHVIRRNVAIKEPLGKDGSAQAQRLKREVTLTAQLNHPGVAAIHDVFDQDGKPMFVMALVRGQTLAQALDDPEMSTSRLIRAVLDACLVMGHAHQHGVIHRDLTPANILLEDNGSIRVIDWGMALRLEEAQLGPSPAGTPGYMPPEQQLGKPLDARTDVWALGVLLYRVVHRTSPPEHTEAIHTDDPLNAICACALNPHPEKRYTDAKAMADDLLRLFDGRRVEAHSMSVWQLGQWLFNRHRLKVVMIGSVLSVIAAVGALGVINTRKEAKLARTAEVESLRQERIARTASALAQRETIQAQKRAAELHLDAGRVALNTGDVASAKRSLRAATALGLHPKQMGLRMRLGMIPEIELMDSHALAPCEGERHLTDDPTLTVCRPSNMVFEGWRGLRRLWRVDFNDHFKLNIKNSMIRRMRIGPERVVLLPNNMGVFSIDLQTGDVSQSKEYPERFASERDTQLSPREGLPCDSVLRVYFDAHATTYMCRDSNVWSKSSEGPLTKLYQGEVSLAHHYAYIENSQEHWMGTADGLIWPLGMFQRRVFVGKTLYEMRPIPKTSYLLINDWNRKWSVFETSRGDWLASFSKDVQKVRPTRDGRLQVLRDDTLQVWKLPKNNPQRTYRSEYGFTDVTWSMDSTTLGMTDGGGKVHIADPMQHKQAKPLAYFGSAAKSITPLPTQGFLAITSYHDTDPTQRPLLNFDVEDGAVVKRTLNPVSVWLGQGSRLEWFERQSVLLISVGRGLHRLYKTPLNHWIREDVSKKGLIDLAVDVTRIRAIAVGPELTALLEPNEAVRHIPSPKGAKLGAINTQGDFAIATKHTTEIHVVGAESPMTLQTPGIMSLTWHPSLPLLVTGHRDGTIKVWHTRTGQLEAQVAHHNGWVVSLAFSPNERFLASASWDSTVRVLSAEPLLDVVRTTKR